MGTRSGDIDVGAVAQVGRVTGRDLGAMEAFLNKESGLLGLSGLSSDCRTLEAAAQQGHAGALLALDVFAHRLARLVGGLATSLRRFDALAFTGGIGQNSARVRAMTLRTVSQSSASNSTSRPTRPVSAVGRGAFRAVRGQSRLSCPPTRKA